MKESVLEFGPGSALVGILTTPPHEAEARSEAVVLVNPGLIHRVGPNRLYVRLARAFAARGFPTLRMDLPGIGDSPLPKEMGADLERAYLAAVRSALDLLEQRGVARRFVMAGLCSGADLSFRVAATDGRVVGAGLVDPNVVVPTTRARMRALGSRLPRLWNPAVWVRGAGRLAGRVLAPASGEGGDGPSADDARALLEEPLRRLRARGVQLCLVATGDRHDVFNYPDQLVDAFPDLDLEPVSRVEILPTADHTFSRHESAAELEAILLSWLAESYPPSG